VHSAILHDLGMELSSDSIEIGKGTLGYAKKDPVVDPLDYGAYSFGLHNVIGCISTDAIDAG